MQICFSSTRKELARILQNDMESDEVEFDVEKFVRSPRKALFSNSQENPFNLGNAIKVTETFLKVMKYVQAMENGNNPREAIRDPKRTNN